MSFDNPCYGCQERSATCHADCSRYRAFYDSRVEARKKRIIKGAAQDFAYESAWKRKKTRLVTEKKYRTYKGSGGKYG